jgi:hypothetical protein
VVLLEHGAMKIEREKERLNEMTTTARKRSVLSLTVHGSNGALPLDRHKDKMLLFPDLIVEEKRKREEKIDRHGGGISVPWPMLC